MKYCILILLSLSAVCSSTFAQKNNTQPYTLADSLRSGGLLAQLYMQKITTKKEAKAGIQVDDVKLFLEADKKEQDILFSFPAGATIVTKGIDVDEEDGNSLEWEHAFAADKPVQLYIATASDSALNYTLYSGYVFLPEQHKWKLIGTCKVNGKWGAVKSAASFTANLKKQPGALQVQQVWAQRGNGSFKELSTTSAKAPVLAPFSNVDSIQQAKLDEEMMQQAIAAGKTDAKQKAEDVYYSIVKEGTGKAVAVTDTVTVFYKGYLFSDGTVFDQTKEKPATFPLNRLIRGWQLALPYCKVGGKIKIVIPSGLAYSIRTRSPKIPPNSMLVFEIEVVDAKPQQ
ncbi:MAG: hypothetical protein GXC73_09745 [Chitinophagaceae bacterium]|nr:hypothetical protein [Chitinophagaceae bacterium]